MYEIDVTLFFLSLLFSFLIILIVQRIRKPQFEIQISDYSLHNKNKMKITHLKIRNRPITYLNRFMNRDFATNCCAQIIVKDASTGQFINKFHELKWASNPEPLKYEWRGEKSFVIMTDPALMLKAGIKNIGERWEDLDIAVKHEGDEQFYINTPQNYPLNLKPLKGRSIIFTRRALSFV